MERKGSRLIRDFPPATLFLDDLMEIVAILTKSCKTIEIKAGDYKISDPDEFESLSLKFSNGRFDNIRIEGCDPYLNVDLSELGISAYISDDTIEQTGIISKIREIIDRGKKIHPIIYGTIISDIPMLIAIYTMFRKNYLISIMLFLTSFALIPLNIKYSLKNKIILHSLPRSKVNSFFERKKDDIFLMVISAIFGGLATYLLTKFIL